MSTSKGLRKEVRREFGLTKIDVNKVVENPFNPRLYYSEESIKELADSIRKHGLIHNILVRENNSRYEIATGHRRFRAIKLLEWNKIPAEVQDLTDDEMLDIAVVENLQREDLTNVEASIIIQSYMKKGLTQEEIAEKLNKSQPWISQTSRLSRLPEKLKDHIIRRLISQSYATEFSNFQAWLETQMEPELSEEEKEQHARGEVNFMYRAIREKLIKIKINSIRELREGLETVKWNLIYSRWWFKHYGDSPKKFYGDEKEYWKKFSHHKSNLEEYKLKREDLSLKELVWMIKKNGEWFPESEYSEDFNDDGASQEMDDKEKGQADLKMYVAEINK